MFQTFRPPPFPIAKISFTSSTKQNSTNRRHRIGTHVFSSVPLPLPLVPVVGTKDIERKEDFHPRQSVCSADFLEKMKREGSALKKKV